MPRPLRVQDFEIAADLARQNVVNFAMTRDSGGFALGAIYVDRVISSLTQRTQTCPSRWCSRSRRFIAPKTGEVL